METGGMALELAVLYNHWQFLRQVVALHRYLSYARERGLEEDVINIAIAGLSERARQCINTLLFILEHEIRLFEQEIENHPGHDNLQGFTHYIVDIE